MSVAEAGDEMNSRDELKLDVGDAPRDPEEAEASARSGASRDLGSDDARSGQLDRCRSRTLDRLLRAGDWPENARTRRTTRFTRHGRSRASPTRRGARRPPGSRLHRPLPLRSARAATRRPRPLARACRARPQPIVGLSDHFVSEAIYLSDPDGHGIEIYWDRPRELWEGWVGERMTTLPLDVGNLLGELDDPAAEPFDSLATGTVMGHVHLKVAAIPDTVAFYRDLLGFGLMAQLGLQAAFLSAGGYHHHIGANTWESSDAPPPPAGTASLRHATIVVPDPRERDRLITRLERGGRRLKESGGNPSVVDPSGNRLLITVA